MSESKTELPVMDDSFTPVGGASPKEGRIVDAWHAHGVVRAKKINGHWETPEGESILVEGWREIVKAAA